MIMKLIKSRKRISNFMSHIDQKSVILGSIIEQIDSFSAVLNGLVNDYSSSGLKITFWELL